MACPVDKSQITQSFRTPLPREALIRIAWSTAWNNFPTCAGGAEVTTLLLRSEELLPPMDMWMQKPRGWGKTTFPCSTGSSHAHTAHTGVSLSTVSAPTILPVSHHKHLPSAGYFPWRTWVVKELWAREGRWIVSDFNTFISSFYCPDVIIRCSISCVHLKVYKSSPPPL